MILKVNNSEFNFLIENGFIKPNGDDFSLSILGKEVDILDLQIDIINEEGVSTIEPKILENLKESFENFYRLYPATDAHGKYPVSRALRSDTGNAFRRYKDLVILNGLQPDDVLRAMIFEVYTKIITSTLDTNNLKYMTNSEAWLVDVGKIKTYIDTSTNDSSFTDFYNNYLANNGKIISTSINIYDTL